MKVVLEKGATKYLESMDRVIQQRIKIEEMPDNCLSSLEPLLSYLVGEPVIETDLTDEEKQWVLEGRKHYREHPEDFVPLETIK